MGYSLASYYTSLGLFVISVPGLWSLIKRSVKSKVLPLDPDLSPSLSPARSSVPRDSLFFPVLFISDSSCEIGGELVWPQVVQKTFELGGENQKTPNQVAGEILSFFTRNNFAVADRGETIT